MSEERFHIDNILKDRFSSFEVDLPVSDWGIIESRLIKRRRKLIAFWATFAFIFLSGIFVVLNLYLKNQSLNQDLRTSSVEENNTVNTFPGADSNSGTKKVDSQHTIVEPIQQTKGNSNKKGYSHKENNVKGSKQSSVEAIDENNRLNSTLSSHEFLEIDMHSKELITVQNQVQENNYTPLATGILEISKPTVKKPKAFIHSIEMGIITMPLYGNDRINSNRPLSIHKDYFSAIRGSSSSESQISNGAHIQLEFAGNWFLRTGFITGTFNVHNNYNYFVNSVPRLNEHMEITNYIPIPEYQVVHQGKYTVRYSGIPLSVGKRIYFSNNWGLETRVGLNIYRLQGFDGKTVHPTNLELVSPESNNSLKKWNSGLTISAGYFYKTKKNFIFTVEPNFSTLLGSATNKGYPVKTTYYNYGLSLNVNYIINGIRL